MAQLKSGSTENSIEILKKDLSNVSSSLSSSVKTALKGDTGDTGSTGSSRSFAWDGDSILKIVNNGNITYSLSGSTLNITT